MFIEERHQMILDRLKRDGRISIGDIQTTFDISQDSARRDLRLLEEQGLLKRTHGGAIPIMQVGFMPPRHRDLKEMEVFENYAAIAKKAAEFVKESDVVYLTSGSLGFIMLKYLPRDIPYTLVVNSVALANEVKFWDNITLYITGGKMRMHETASLVDSFATAFVKNMHFDVCLMTGAGIDASFGFSNGTDETATFQRAVIEHSRSKILMMPNAKVGFKAFIKVCDANKFDTLITDWDAVEDELNKLEETGINAIVVEREQPSSSDSVEDGDRGRGERKRRHEGRGERRDARDRENRRAGHRQGEAGDGSPSQAFFAEVVKYLMENGEASTILLQRQFRIGFNRAERLLAELERRGIVSSDEGENKRRIIITPEEYEAQFPEMTQV